MYTCIPDVLNAGQLKQLNDLFERQSFVDGRTTAGAVSGQVKSNLQLSADAADHAAMQQMVLEAIGGNSQFRLAAMPKSLQPIRFARYLPGMFYGRHVDNPVMGKDPQMRVDLAFTLFLSPSKSYEGGELLIEEPGFRRAYKLPAGALVVYPANSLHEVAEVTAGRRDVAVGWLQSLVRDPLKRRIIFELEEARGNLLGKIGKAKEFDTLSRNINELWHMWIEV